MIFSSSFINTPQGNASTEDAYDFSWLDPGKKIFVLQNRRYRKDNKFHSPPVQVYKLRAVDSFNISTRGSYFFTEEFGVELVYSTNSGKENDTATSVRNPGGSGSIPFRRIVDQYFGAYFSWAPFYSKINTFNKIIYLDIIFNFGLASMTESNNAQEVNVGSAGSFAELEENSYGIELDVA